MHRIFAVLQSSSELILARKPDILDVLNLSMHCLSFLGIENHLRTYPKAFPRWHSGVVDDRHPEPQPNKRKPKNRTKA